MPVEQTKEPIDAVIEEFEFLGKEKILFLALIGAIAIDTDDETKEALLLQTEAVIPREVLDAAIAKLDQLRKA